VTDPRRALGAEGEARAARYLERRGYRVEARNVRAGGVEIDLVVARGRTLAFVEVKTRSGARHGSPFLAVDARKQARLARGAAAWLSKHPARRFGRVRFDVIAVWRDSRQPAAWRVEHWPDAFEPP